MNISMKSLHMVTFILLVIGGLNWLLVAFGWNLVEMIGNATVPIIATIIYVLVGLSAIYEVVTHKKNCKECGEGAPSGGAM